MNRREFQFSEGSSNKFWSIELRDQSFIVHYGKIGTHGQAQEKSFASAEAAKKEHDKLIAEKTKKGYVEVQVGDASKSRPMPVVKQVEDKAEEKPGKKEITAESSKTPTSEGVSVTGMPAMTSSAAQQTSRTSVAPASLKLERCVRLELRDRATVSWLWQPVQRPQPRPFDLGTCVKEARRWFSSYGYITTHTVDLPAVISRSEAWFWLQARGAGLAPSRHNWHGGWQNRQVKTLEEWEEILLQAQNPMPEDPVATPLMEQTIEAACHSHQWLPALIPFFSAEELASRMIDAEERRLANAKGYVAPANEVMAEALNDFMLVYESAESRERFRTAMAARFHAESDSRSLRARLALLFLSMIRGGEELDAYLAATDASNVGQSSLGMRALAGLPDEERFVKETRRLFNGMPPPNGYYIERVTGMTRTWLAATEWRELDLIVKTILVGTSKDETAKLARLLALVEAPEAAPAMLEVLMHSKAPAVAAEWFAENPLHTAVGLAPVAMGSGKAAEAARDQLHRLRRSGQQDVLSAALPHLAENEREWLQREIIDHREELLDDLPREEMPPALAEAFAARNPLKAIAWLQSASLPPIKISGKKLALADVERVLSVLRDSPLAATLQRDALADAVQKNNGVELALPEVAATAPLLVTLLKQHADAASLDTFAWKLFEQWLAMGAASKDKWALGAIGHIGGDASVLKLTPLVRDWPGESQHQRAVFGLEVLRAVGTDTALMSLNGIAQKLKFQGLKEKAKLMMEGIAQARGFTREQLADRIVPDCGLDEQGGRVFDFGPRQFKFVLGAEMKPLVRDAAGKMKTDLPSPNSSDDKEKAEAAVAAWKLLKKTLKEVLKIQAERLEDAMITGRRWTPEEFHTLLVKHPLMVNLARQLVFGCYDGQGAVQSTFRITEDQSLADSNDDPCDLPGAGSIGVVHPAHLDDAAKSAWGQVLSDYEIIPPFQQLGREICRAEPGDLELKEITRFKGPKIPGITVYGILERTHWVKDTPADAGGFVQHSKFFPSANVTAFIQYTGMSMGYYEEPQEIESVYFVPGHVRPEMWGRHDNKLPIKTVDPVVISEVLRLVRAIMAKAE